MDETPEEKRARKKALALEKAKQPNKNTYVTTTQCTAIYKNTGEQCRHHAVKGRTTCFRHGGKTPRGGPLHPNAARGTQEYWKRIREAAEKDPTFLKRTFNPRHSPEHLQKLSSAGREAIARKRAGLEPLPKPLPPTADEKVVLRADKIVTAELKALPAVPDKPFAELEPHEQLVVVTGLSLTVVHDILKMKWTGETGEVNLKAASLVKDTALRTLSIRVKVDQNALMAKRQDKMTDLLQRIREEQERSGESARVIDVKAGS